MTTLRDQLLAEGESSRREADRIRHEATVTKRILARLAPQVSIPALLRDADGHNTVISLGLVSQVVSGFPLRLFAKNVPYLLELGINQLLAGDLFHTLMFRSYLEHIENNGWDETKLSIGMIFPWPHATTVVLHNWPRTDERIDRHKGCGRFTMVTCKFSPPRIYTLEPLDALLDAIES